MSIKKYNIKSLNKKLIYNLKILNRKIKNKYKIIKLN